MAVPLLGSEVTRYCAPIAPKSPEVDRSGWVEICEALAGRFDTRPAVHLKLPVHPVAFGRRELRHGVTEVAGREGLNFEVLRRTTTEGSRSSILVP